jgi:hypothetical protein
MSSRAILEESLSDLDHDTLVRLQQARARAVQASPRPLFWLTPASGFAAASLAVLAVVLWWLQPIRPLPGHGVEDLDIIISVENIELFDDLEFYHWLAEQHDREG